MLKTKQKPLNDIRGNWIIRLQDSPELEARWIILKQKLLTEPTSSSSVLEQIERFQLIDGLIEFLVEETSKSGEDKAKSKIVLSTEVPFQSRLNVIDFLLCYAVLKIEESVLGILYSIGGLEDLLLELASKRNLAAISPVLHEVIFELLSAQVKVVAGRYAIGAVSGDRTAWDNERPRHYLRLSSFSISRFPLTYGVHTYALQNISKEDPPATMPVDRLSWEEAIKLCNAYSAMRGYPSAYELKLQADGTAINWREGSIGFRLPTEAEWEAAARANTRHIFSGGGVLSEVGWGVNQAAGRIMPVGLKKPNDWGIFDMTGNVWEWCWDGYDSKAYSKRVSAAQKGKLIDGRDPLRDPKGHTVSKYAVARGGSAATADFDLRLSYRGRFNPEKKLPLVGLRFAQSQR
ncbi:MAG: hypothetical protein CMK59_08945 [Proteobacteria bacterium]|nr:hypothetical protein [Pseudomonadota bacterium]